MNAQLLTRETAAGKLVHGPEVKADGGVTFRLWAPACDRVRVELVDEARLLDMELLSDGWHSVHAPSASGGSRYRFVLPDGLRVPDPASRFQPEDVHGPSRVVDVSSWSWNDTEWRGRPWREAVVYELHVGSFTPEGTFGAAVDKLDHLVSLGVTAIELMPIADFPGRRNWGYDGVLPYAPDSSYGEPEDLKAFVEAAHARDLMVLLDVVYNHFGPDGNYLSLYAPEFFTSRYKTPWGDALNYGHPAVREFIIQNAIYWVRDYHLDGLRLDAVHAIVDDGPTHLLEELTRRVHDAVGDRLVHLILENEHNQSQWLARDAAARPTFYTAQWNDDVHHVLHTAITGEKNGYYAEYCKDTTKLARALSEGFAFQGEPMGYRGTPRGEPSAHLPPKAFVAFLQNHDQIGNRAFGDRLAASVPPEALRAACATYLLLPQIPMLFMGEEWSTRSPFPFFCDFAGELGEAVRKGRREEFAKFPEFQAASRRGQIPDPQADETFASGKLAWNELHHPDQAAWLDWYRRILAARRQWIVPLIDRIHHGGSATVLAPAAVAVQWQVEDGQELRLDVNLSPEPATLISHPEGDIIWNEGDVGSAGILARWSVRWSIRGT